jgi:uncharacterized protein YjbI with pentapeptide repeats
MLKKSLTPVLLCVVLGIVVLVSWNSIYTNVHCAIRGVGFDLVGCDLRGADFSGENLTGVDLSRANLTGANLGVTEFIKIVNPKFAQIPLLSDNNMFFDSDFSNCTRHCFVLMRIVYWYGAFLYKNQPGFNDGITKLNHLLTSGANLTDANLSNANLTGADLTGVTISHADLSGATLTNISSGRITGIPNVLPADWMLVNGYLLGPSVNLAQTTLSNIDLSHVNLSRANLVGIKSHHITGSSLLLPTDWQLVAGHLVGPTADLMGADFTGEQLVGVNFAGNNLAYANLSGTNLSGANLTDANLKGASLSDTNLDEANLTNIQSTGIIGTPKTLPPDWQLINRFLVGPRANLSNADFSHANLANLNLTHVNFAGANLSYADLSGANLAGANLTGANLAGVVWNNTTCPDGTVTRNTRCEIP